MPRGTIELEQPVETLSILDEDGNLDDELLPELDHEQARRFLEQMILSRRVDERRLVLQRQGKIGTFAPVSGQEAAQVGSVAALGEKDWVVPSFREPAVAIARGLPIESMLLYDAGYNEGAAMEEDGRDLPVAIPVASQLPHAAGLAYALKVQERGEVVMVYFGDGATSEGDFHEALNLAAVLAAPVIFLCQNNHWAISVPVARQTHSASIAQKAVAYGVPGLQVDGNDVLAVEQACREAVERAREGGGPTLIECVTYRLSVHTTADDPKKYRDEEEVDEWRARDPIERLKRLLLEREVIDEGAGHEQEQGGSR